jgi:hypothetical protein
MAVGPIQFSVSTNPIDALNARLLEMGRAEIVTELKSTPALVSGGHYHDIAYIARNGGRKAYSIFQGPMNSANDLVSNLIAHINAVELTAKEAHSSLGSLNLSPQRNPIDVLNNRLKALGRKEIITSIKSFMLPSGYNHDVCYINREGETWTYGYSQSPTGSMDHFAEKFFAQLGAAEHVAKEREDRKRDNPLTFKVNSAVLADMEYQQYLDDHKAMTLGTLFGENRFPRARERAFLDFRTVAASQSHYECEDRYTSDVKDIVIRKTLCLYLAHRVPGFKEHMLAGSGISDKKALIRLSWFGNAKSVLIPLSQDMPWYTAAQQARDTLKEWIDAAAQKSAAQEKFGKGEIKINVPSDYATQQGTAKQEAATAGNDYIVSIWDINYPKARVEYHEGIEQVRSTWGFAQGIYKAGAKTSGIPRAVDENGPFNIALKYAKGDIVVLRNCSWIADGEVQCERIETNWKSALMPSEPAAQRVAAKQQIPKGAMVNSDGEVVGANTRKIFGTYVGESDSLADLNAAIDRASKALPVPTENEIKQAFLDRMAQEGYQFTSAPTLNSIASAVAASTHDTYRAIAQVAEDARLQHEASRAQFDNLTSQPLTAEALKKAFDLMKASPSLPNLDDYYRNQLDNTPQIGDTVTKETASMSMVLPPGVSPPLRQRATAEAIEVAYRAAAIKLPDLVRKQLIKRMAAKGGKRPSQARLSLAEDMLSGDEGSLIVAGILSLALSASPEFIKSKMPWLDLDRLAKELRLNVETRIACAVADMLGMYLDGALDALKEAFGGSQQLLLAEGGKADESALFNGVTKAESVGVR